MSTAHTSANTQKQTNEYAAGPVFHQKPTNEWVGEGATSQKPTNEYAAASSFSQKVTNECPAPRKRGGQPGNRNAVKTGYRTAEAKAHRAKWRDIMREVKAVVAVARDLCRARD